VHKIFKRGEIMKNNIRGVRGFTLGELLVVIAIFAVLFALLFVGKGENTEAEISTCMTTLGQMTKQKEAYDSGNEYEKSKICKDLNKLIDKYNKDGCKEILEKAGKEKEAKVDIKKVPCE
jgi:prepilin-type N-terminal cleavage/methylation domain-containing protein